MATVDKQTFEAATLPHAKKLYNLALGLTRNSSAAEDLVQEAFLKAFASWNTFTSGTECCAWLYQIVKNSFIDNYRKQQTSRKFAKAFGDDVVASLYGDNTRARAEDLETCLLHDDLSDEVVAALESLPAEAREVVVLADIEGMKYQEIADKLGCPIGTVMSRLFRARRTLESQLANYAAKDYGIKKAA